MPESDSTLRRIANGDQDATRACIARHGGLVWAMARRDCGSRAEAEDLVQEIFIELWANAGRFDPTVATEITFVAMIARRRLIDRRRKLGRRPESVPLPDGLTGPDRPASRSVELQDEAESARRALEALPDDQRLVLLLAIEQSMTYEQIARRTGMPLGTVKTHARRGLIRLRELLGATSQRTSSSPRTQGVTS